MSPIATCAINLSGATFGDDGFIDFVREQFDLTAFRRQMICFEITETSAIASIDERQPLHQRIAGAGLPVLARRFRHAACRRSAISRICRSTT